MTTEGSDYDRLFYPYLFQGGQVDWPEVMKSVTESTWQKSRETIELRGATFARYRGQIVAVGQAVAQAFSRGATLLAWGNGGSSTDAQDLVADLTCPPQSAWRSLPAIALTHDVAAVTAIANDVGFDNVFVRQIIAFGRRGDVGVGLSTSGNSPNVLLGLEQAKKQGMLTVAITGYDGGPMGRSPSVDYAFIIESDHVPRIQEAQLTLYHAIVEVVHLAVSSFGLLDKETPR